jgi:NAD(P)-dependent dehydrogenase (short-subunit alcohol dehydrogenase family)
MRLTFKSVPGKILSKVSEVLVKLTCSYYDRYQDFLAQFDTNVFGTIKVTRALLPHFRQRRTGTMVFIGSLSGWIGHAGCSAYAGSKFALEGEIVQVIV